MRTAFAIACVYTVNTHCASRKLIRLTTILCFPRLLHALLHLLSDVKQNVHFRHTARLINSLIAARKPYDLLIFPDERHSPRKLQDRY
jgi:Prolyl oligopeptidase family